MEDNTKYSINVGTFKVGDTEYENRCLSASIGGSGVSSTVIPWADTEYNPWDYKYENGEFILDVIELPEPEEPSDPQAETDEILLDHEERLILLEVGE